MKRFGIFILCISALLVLSSCAENSRCTIEMVLEQMHETAVETDENGDYAAKTAEVFVYSENQGYLVDSAALAEMIDGKWEKSAKPGEFNKIASVVVDTQYEICLFENGYAMIYCGYAGIFDSDRQYYKVELSASLKEICNFAIETGEKVIVTE